MGLIRKTLPLAVVAGMGTALPGCATIQAPPPGAPAIGSAVMPGASGWRRYATMADRDRLTRVRPAWEQALREARTGGRAADLAALGPLADPDALMTEPAPPPGDYRCRTIKLGAQAPGAPVYTAYDWFRCRIQPEDDHLLFVKENGSQRPAGRLWNDNAGRMVFLGTMILGDETDAYAYGADRERNLVGALERIGERRWRLALPWPAWESTLDIIELVPASD